MKQKLTISVESNLLDEKRGSMIELVVTQDNRRYAKFFAMAEVNASRQCVHRWIGECGIATSKAIREVLEKALQDVPEGRKGSVAEVPGWYGRRFVLPSRVYGPRQHLTINMTAGRSAGKWQRRGSLDGWKEVVTEICELGPVPIVAFALAFSGPLLRFTDETSIIMMLSGETSLGKTSLQRMVSTVWGRDGEEGFMTSFLKTPEEFERAALANRDTLLVLDETGLISADSKSRGALFGHIVLRLASPIPKDIYGRETPSGSIRGSFLLSSNDNARTLVERARYEYSPQLAVRIVDLHVETAFPVFRIEARDAGARADEVDRLLANLRKHPGVAADSFLTRLTSDLASDRKAFEERVARYVQEGLEAMGPTASGVALDRRLARRLAIVYAAGRLAVRYGILPIRRDALCEAITEVWKCVHRQLIESVRRDPFCEFVSQLLREITSFVDLTNHLPTMSKSEAKAAPGFIKHVANGKAKIWLGSRALSKLTSHEEGVLRRLEQDDLLRRDRVNSEEKRQAKRQVKVTVARDVDGEPVRLRVYEIRVDLPHL